MFPSTPRNARANPFGVVGVRGTRVLTTSVAVHGSAAVDSPANVFGVTERPGFSVLAPGYIPGK